MGDRRGTGILACAHLHLSWLGRVVGSSRGGYWVPHPFRPRKGCGFFLIPFLPRGEKNPPFFSRLYGVPSRPFLPYPRLMTATRPWLETPRLPRAHPLWKRAYCVPTNLWSGRAYCVPVPLSASPALLERFLKVPALQQLGGRSIARTGSHPSLARRWSLTLTEEGSKILTSKTLTQEGKKAPLATAPNPFRSNSYEKKGCNPRRCNSYAKYPGGGATDWPEQKPKSAGFYFSLTTGHSRILGTARPCFCMLPLAMSAAYCTPRAL